MVPKGLCYLDACAAIRNLLWVPRRNYRALTLAHTPCPLEDYLMNAQYLGLSGCACMCMRPCPCARASARVVRVRAPVAATAFGLTSSRLVSLAGMRTWSASGWSMS